MLPSQQSSRKFPAHHRRFRGRSKLCRLTLAASGDDSDTGLLSTRQGLEMNRYLSALLAECGFDMEGQGCDH